MVEKDVLFGLKQGTTVLKQLQKEMNLDMVEQLISDSAEGIAYQKEVDQSLQSRITAGEEEEVQEELEKLLQEQVSRSFLIRTWELKDWYSSRLRYLRRPSLCYQIPSSRRPQNKVRPSLRIDFSSDHSSQRSKKNQIENQSNEPPCSLKPLMLYLSVLRFEICKILHSIIKNPREEPAMID